VSLQIRKLHAYIGMLIAPAVVFFATTGLLQIYSLHEAHGDYSPPPLVEMLSSVHKDQRFALGHHKPPSGAHRPKPESGAGAGQPPHEDSTHTATPLLKAFFALVAISLIFTTLAGIWMALQQSRNRRMHLVLLAIGIVVPFALAALTA
jgi:hypothetical protein